MNKAFQPRKMEATLFLGFIGMGALLWRQDMKGKVAHKLPEGQKRNGTILEQETRLPINEQYFTDPVLPDQRFFSRSYPGALRNPQDIVRRQVRQPSFVDKLAAIRHSAQYHSVDQMKPQVGNSRTEPFSRFDTKLFVPEGIQQIQEAFADIPSRNQSSGILARRILENRPVDKAE